jgi:hypothetical protein
MSANNFIKYWRNTLADAARIEIKLDGKALFLKNCTVDVESGQVAIQQANQLIDREEQRINYEKGIENREHEDWQSLNEVQILISSFLVSPIPEYIKIVGEGGPFYPFWIKAIVSRQGNLRPDDDTFPYIPRVHLEPQINEKVNFIFSDVDTIDKVYADAFTEKSWPEYWDYLKSIFQESTGQPLENYKPENFLVSQENTIVINNIVRNPADGIIQLYDFLLKSEKTPRLLHNICNPQEEPLKPLLSIEDFEAASLNHLGQMGHEHPLSVSQRRSLYHFNTLKDGSILAVNGPPGTGKTTLLQSIVANEVVLSAIERDRPRIIVACSTNNQAVTNIIDSFRNVKARQGILYKRWIPEITSFGLYLPSKSKNIDPKVIYYKGLFDEGIHKKIENHAFVDEARKVYCQNFFEHTGLASTVNEIVEYLQDELKQRNGNLIHGVALWRKFKSIPNQIRLLGADSNLFAGSTLNISALSGIEDNLLELEKKFSSYLDTESIWIKLFSFFKFVKEKRATRLKQIFRECLVDYEAIDFYRIDSFHQFFDQRLSLVKSIRQTSNTWTDWKKQHSISGDPPNDEAGFKKRKSHFFYDELEVSAKNEMFYLAAHYWEGRWLLETERVLAEDRLFKNGQVDSLMRFQRLAMLTPCFVSTFYMAPKFFTYSKFVKKLLTRNVFEAPPLLESIDLLIVDEAGQVSPEVGAATFALAKRAIVVGDTKQIEPVWSVPQKIDHANLHRYDLVSTKDDFIKTDELQSKGFLGSSGSVMMLAQKSSCYRVNSRMERGLLLTEHRRCFDEIIEYCNKLAYDGLLEPMKGKARDVLFEPMKFIFVDGESFKDGSSRTNSLEAIEIAKWLQLNNNKIVKHYQDRENSEASKENRKARTVTLSEIVGIITPFKGQKLMIKSALKKNGIDTSGLTIGTVHALQGAERPIILFSSVYGKNNIGGGYFFDRGVNMLNVAVSRAKENFIVFGCPEVFQGSNGTPSSLLYKHIERVENILV